MVIENPKCSKHQKCILVCKAASCTHQPFMCNDEQCQCSQSHSKCIASIKWNIMKSFLLDKIIEVPIEIKNYLQQIKGIYRSTIQSLQKSYKLIQSLSDSAGLNRLQREVFQMLQQKRWDDLNGQSINKIQFENKSSWEICINNEKLQQEKQKIHQQAQKIINMLQNLVNQKQKLVLQSSIINNSFIVSRLFNRNIKKLTLLYRASQNNFQADKFHEKCDGKPNTITILKTQFDKIIGGYTPIVWDQSLSGKYSKDISKQSFVFSLTNQHQIKLVQGKQDLAIKNYSSCGPIFGNDLFICDKANQDAKSWANIGSSYHHNEYKYQNKWSAKKFTGSGGKFKILEWQVHQIIFQ